MLFRSVRALKMHGGLDKKELAVEDIGALERGIPNLLRHVSILRLLAEKFKNKQTIIIKQRDNGEVEAFIKGD